MQADEELQVAPGKTSFIRLNLIYLPLQATWDEELDLDELEFLLANLIANNFIKGYISHEQRILALAKDPFPQLA